MSDLAKERVIFLPRDTYGSCFISVIEVESPKSSVSYESSTAMPAVITELKVVPVSQEQGRREYPSKRLPGEVGGGTLRRAEKAGTATDCLYTCTLLAYCMSIRLEVLSKLHSECQILISVTIGPYRLAASGSVQPAVGLHK